MTEDPVQSIRNGDDYKKVTLAAGENVSACIAACCADPLCACTSWNGPPYTNPPFCFLKNALPPLSPNTYGPGVRTAFKVGFTPPPTPGPPPPVKQNVYVTTIPPSEAALLGPFGMDALHFGTDSRAIRARYPNSDPEFVPEYLSAGQWTKPVSLMSVGLCRRCGKRR
jgi:hypothetical protein